MPSTATSRCSGSPVLPETIRRRRTSDSPKPREAASSLRAVSNSGESLRLSGGGYVLGMYYREWLHACSSMSCQSVDFFANPKKSIG